ncbi:hypothetical protein C8Q80DRAFT_438353 [Daedaleopsis nitida]|nr:hypothetical protein C8Q80DRAFT_438353 [Daedaleopsis nitida]
MNIAYAGAAVSVPPDVILVAQNTQFYLHRAALAHFDPRLFDNMVAASLQAVGVHENAGLCTLYLSDTAYDLTQFVHIVYAHSAPPDGIPFPVLAAWLRLAARYNIPRLAHAALAQLKSLFPTTLSGWDDRAEARKRHGYQPDHAIEAVNALRMLGNRGNALGLLPAALYACTQLEHDVRARCMGRIDGTPERLSHEDIELALCAKARFRVHGATLVERLTYLTVPRTCAKTKGGLGCMFAVRALLWFPEADVVRGLLGGDPFSTDFLDHLDSLCDGEDEEEVEMEEGEEVEPRRACAQCADAVREQFDRLREEVWMELPRIFGVGHMIRGWGV